MQCLNCQFENMPGTRNCARCGSLIIFGGVAVDVHPPRAKRWFAPGRRLVQRRYAVMNRVDRVLETLRPASLRGQPYMTSLTLDLVIRFLLPGWAQFYLRRRGRGYTFMIAAIFAALLALVLVGTTPGNLAFGLLFSMHAASISDALMPAGSSVRRSLFYGLMVYAVLGMVLYLPAIRLVSLATTCYVVQTSAPGIAQGDVLHVRHFAFPARGQLVLYLRQEARFVAGDHRAVLIRAGPAVERVLALPGDHVQSVNGALWVNGAPAPYRPLNPIKFPPFDFTIQPGEFMVLPNFTDSVSLQEYWQRLTLAPVTDILGVIYLRSYPWPRFGPVR